MHAVDVPVVARRRGPTRGGGARRHRAERRRHWVGRIVRCVGSLGHDSSRDARWSAWMTARSAQSTPLIRQTCRAARRNRPNKSSLRKSRLQSRYTLRHLHPSNMSALGLLAPLAVAGGVNTCLSPHKQTVEMGTAPRPPPLRASLVSLRLVGFYTPPSQRTRLATVTEKKSLLTYFCAHVLSLVAASRSL